MNFKLGLVLVSLLLLTGAVAAQTGNHTADEHDGHGGNEGLHHAAEASQIVLSVLAIAGVILATSKFWGGRLAVPLAVTGIGVAVFALERLIHSLSEYGIGQALGPLTQQGFWLLSSLLFAIGYGMLYLRLDAL